MSRLRAGEESGQVIVLFVLSLVALLGIAGLVLDVGTAWVEKRHDQAAVDAAVLAAAAELPESTSAATAAAQDYATRNERGAGLLAPSFSTAGTTNDTVTLTLKSTVQTSFARVVGKDQFDVTVRAKASVKSYKGFSSPIVPWAVAQADLRFDQTVVVHSGGGGAVAPGNFGAVDLPVEDDRSDTCPLSTGGNDYEDALAGRLDVCTVRIGSTLSSAGGVKSGPTQSGLEDRRTDGRAIINPFDPATVLQPDGAGGTELAVFDHPNVVLIPVINAWPNGNGNVTVQGFAWFVITRYDRATVEGRFVHGSLSRPDMMCQTGTGLVPCPLGAYDAGGVSKVIQLSG